METEKTETCEKHGEYVAKRIELFGHVIHSVCPLCADEIDKEREEAVNRKERDDRQRRIYDALVKADIPERFTFATLGNYQQINDGAKNAVESCRRFIADYRNVQREGSALFLCGGVGTGKTHLAVALLKELLETEKIHSGIYTTTMRMIRDIRSSYKPGALKTEDELIKKYVATGLLVLDEIGVQGNTENERMLLFDVINGRYEKGGPMVLVSNLEIKLVEQYLGERAFDRLKSKSGIVVGFDWESWRGR